MIIHHKELKDLFDTSPFINISYDKNNDLYIIKLIKKEPYRGDEAIDNEMPTHHHRKQDIVNGVGGIAGTTSPDQSALQNIGLLEDKIDDLVKEDNNKQSKLKEDIDLMQSRFGCVLLY